MGVASVGQTAPVIPATANELLKVLEGRWRS